MAVDMSADDADGAKSSSSSSSSSLLVTSSTALHLVYRDVSAVPARRYRVGVDTTTTARIPPRVVSNDKNGGSGNKIPCAAFRKIQIKARGLTRRGKRRIPVDECSTNCDTRHEQGTPARSPEHATPVRRLRTLFKSLHHKSSDRSIHNKDDVSSTTLDPSQVTTPKMTPDLQNRLTPSLLDKLPPEIQSHLLLFIPTKTLCRGLARTSRYWHSLVDDHVRRVVTAHLLSSERAEACGLEPRSKLVFEAQRPIDTLAQKHTLYFSHFSRGGAEGQEGNGSKRQGDDEDKGKTATSGVVRTTTAHFVFEPVMFVQDDEHLDEDETEETTGGVDRSAEEASTTATAARLRGVAPPHSDRLRSEHHISSLHHETRRGRARQRIGGHSHAAAARVADADLYNPLDAYDWAGPVVSSMQAAHSQSRSPRASRSRQRSLHAYDKPTYRMQLDPLDSFETWMLTLTLRVTSKYAAVGTTNVRWERRIADGLDRVYRDWFRRPNLAALEEDLCKNVHWSGMSADLLQRIIDASNDAAAGDVNSDSDSALHPSPPVRNLEIDSQSAQLVIQPHAPSSSANHPALLSSYSHAYLSTTQSSLAYSTFNKSQRVELRFHIDHVEMNAARLASHLEVIEQDMADWERAHCEATRRHGQQQSSISTITANAPTSSLFAHRGRARGISAAVPGTL